MRHYSEYTKPILIIILIAAVCLLVRFIFSNSSNEISPPKVYRIAIDESWYPVHLYNQDEYITAFSIALLREIAALEHFPVEIVRVEAPDLLDKLDKGDYEGILSSLVFQEENALKYISSNPYYVFGPVLVVAKSSNIKSLNDLNGATIGIITRSQFVRSLNQNAGIRFVYYEYNDRNELINDVVNKKIDGMILDMILAEEYVRSGLYTNELKIVSTPLTREGLRLIVKNNEHSKKLIQEFDSGLSSLKKSGRYNQLLLKWELFNPENLQ